MKRAPRGDAARGFEFQRTWRQARHKPSQLFKSHDRGARSLIQINSPRRDAGYFFESAMTEGNRMSWGEALYLAMAVAAFAAFIATLAYVERTWRR